MFGIRIEQVMLVPGANEIEPIWCVMPSPLRAGDGRDWSKKFVVYRVHR